MFHLPLNQLYYIKIVNTTKEESKLANVHNIVFYMEVKLAVQRILNEKSKINSLPNFAWKKNSFLGREIRVLKKSKQN